MIKTGAYAITISCSKWLEGHLIVDSDGKILGKARIDFSYGASRDCLIVEKKNEIENHSVTVYVIFKDSPTFELTLVEKHEKMYLGTQNVRVANAENGIEFISSCNARMELEMIGEFGGKRYIGIKKRIDLLLKEKKIYEKYLQIFSGVQ